MSAALHEVGSTFRHGIHPPEEKGRTASLPLERMPFVRSYVLPLGQHIGAPSRPVVDVGDDVTRGQLIAEPGGFVSTALHAPVSGRITDIDYRLHPGGKMQLALVIEADPWSSQELPASEPVDISKLDIKEIVRRVQMAGIVGLGGAAFPTHVKLSPPEGRRIRIAVINGCECEPYLTCDHRIMVERATEVVRGGELLMQITGAERCLIGVELNKPDAIEALRAIGTPNVEVLGLQVKYPQGAEKMLIDALLGEQVPAGGLPLDLEVLTNNVATSALLADLFDHGRPLVERALTVTGPGIAHPKNLMVPIGTPLRAVIEHCGGLVHGEQRVVLGGPMMGAPQKSLDAPVVKGTSGILCLDTASFELQRELACIRCGRCVEACPMFLNPARLAKLARAERPDELEQAHLMSCFECASCSYICPSHIPLVQWMRVGKAQLRGAKAAKAAKADKT